MGRAPWLQTWNDQMRRRSHVLLVVLAGVVGALGGLGAVVFRQLIHLAEPLFWQGARMTTTWVETLPPWWVVLAPTVGGLLVGAMVYYLSRESGGHGVPEVMRSLSLNQGRIRPRVAAVKTIASAITIGSGGSTGREGPIIQIGASVGSTLGQLLHLPPRTLRTITGAGAAAGIAATFNAPIAGAVFVVEILLQDLRVTSFTPIIVASVAATAVGREFLGDRPAFQIPAYSLASPLELIAYAVLGLAAAVVAVSFVRLLTAAEETTERTPLWAPLKPAIGGAIVGCIALLSPHVLGVGYEATETALLHNPAWTWLGTLLVLKLVATCITLGSGGSGGVFSPSLFLGAMLGGLLGAAMNALFPGAVGAHGAYALVGMGAVVAATTHAPLTAILILFEMTGDYRIILPLMVSCTLATLVATWLLSESIYTIRLTRSGIQLKAGRDVNVLRGVRATDIMRTDYATLPADTPLLEILGRIAHDEEHAFFVEGSEGRFLGILSLRDLRPVLGDIESSKDLVVAGDLAATAEAPVAPEDTLDEVLARLQAAHRDELPVVDGGRLVGSVHLEDILTSYRREMFKRELVPGISDALVTDRGAMRSLGDYVVAEVEAPHPFVGRTLAELDLRGRHGVTVLVVRPPGGPDVAPVVPTADHRIQAGSVLVVMGREPAVRRVRHLF